MADFLDVSDKLRRKQAIGKHKESFDLVFKAVAALQSVHSKSSLDLDNIESVFAAFDMSVLFDRGFGGLTKEEIQELPSAMRKVIVHTLEQSIDFSFSDGRVHPPKPYLQFAELIKSLVEDHRESASVITFNYDLGLDYAFRFVNRGVDYALAAPGGIPLLKLHGSLNWARCSVCSDVRPWSLNELFSTRNWETYGLAPGTLLKLPIVDQMPTGFKHCDQAVLADPIIVPPTWNKTQHHQVIADVWRRAAQHLSEAENIIVIGYSLPESDHFFRYLYALGTAGGSPLKKFWVFNPDTSGGVKRRYEDLLGQAAQKRFEYTPIMFSAALHPIRTYLDLDKG